MGGNALLAGTHQVEADQPFVERDLAALHHRPHRDREVFAAFLFGAPINARPLRRIGVSDNTAMRTNRTFRPKHAL